MEPGEEDVATTLNQVYEYIKRIAEVQPVTPLDAATQTPRALTPPMDVAPMIAESEEDMSEYEKHFSQGTAKDDKARKLANRTPEAEGKATKKLGKKQRNQLQFNSQADQNKHSDTGRTEHSTPEAATADATKDHQPSRRTKDSPENCSKGAPLDINPGGRIDNRRGKEVVVVGNSPGK
ncbi:unnamed protein product [Calypogeia fissa]